MNNRLKLLSFILFIGVIMEAKKRFNIQAKRISKLEETVASLQAGFKRLADNNKEAGESAEKLRRKASKTEKDLVELARLHSSATKSNAAGIVEIKNVLDKLKKPTKRTYKKKEA